jgi:hypothetical protein
MADLTPQEKRVFDRVLAMGDGYVLNFSNRSFDEFVSDSTGRLIGDTKYDYGSGSKANRLRGFWKVESNPVVAKLLGDLLDYAVEHGAQETDPHFARCRRAIARLRQTGPVPEIEAALLPGQDFDVLSASQ